MKRGAFRLAELLVVGPAFVVGMVWGFVLAFRQGWRRARGRA